MKRSAVFTLFGALVLAIGLSACGGPHCPGVSGTGNYAATKHRAKRKYCAGVDGTGNRKPSKLRKKKEEGLMSKKEQKAMAKAQRKKAGPLEGKKLSFDD